jgi:hypothetical protein
MSERSRSTVIRLRPRLRLQRRKRRIRRYINRTYTVALGPYFGACQKPASNAVRSEVEVRAGLCWRCGRVSVRDSGGYDYITARWPIGC